MTRIEILEALRQWQEENPEDRSFLFIAQECDGKSKNSSYGIVGDGKKTAVMLANAFNSDKNLIPLVKQAMIISIIASVFNDDSKDNETKNEEGEQ